MLIEDETFWRIEVGLITLTLIFSILLSLYSLPAQSISILYTLMGIDILLIFIAEAEYIIIMATKKQFRNSYEVFLSILIILFTLYIITQYIFTIFW